MITFERKLGRFLPYRVGFFPTAEQASATIASLTLGSMARLISSGGLNGPAARRILRHEVGATSCVDLGQKSGKIFRSMHASSRNKIGKAERLGSRSIYGATTSLR